MLQLKVQRLTEQELDHSAAELLQKYSRWKGKAPAPPIDIEDILEGLLSLTFEIVDLEKKLGVQGVLGAAWFDEGRVAVDQSLETQEGRFAFTLAHECGHWVIHRPQYEISKMELSLFASPKPTKADAVVCRSADRQAPAEWQANQFAGRILMPPTFVRKAMQAAHGDLAPSWAGLRRKADRDEYDPQLQKVAATIIEHGSFSNVSNEAMRRRLVQLKLVRDSAEQVML